MAALKKNHKYAPSYYSILVFFSALMLTGIFLIPYLNITPKSEINFNIIKISYNWYNTSPEIIEEEVTSKLEGILTSIKGVNGVKSNSSRGYGYIEVSVDDGTNEREIKYEISVLIRQIYPSFPSRVSYPRIQSNRELSEQKQSVLVYTVTGNNNVNGFVNSVFKRKLALIEGISQINAYGGTNYVWNLVYDPAEAEKYGVNIASIIHNISLYFNKYELGKANIQQHNIDSESDYAYVSLKTDRSQNIDWSKITINVNKGRNIHLTDLFRVSYEEEEPQGFHRINGTNTINVSVVLEKEIFSTTSKIAELVEDIKKTLPPGIIISNDYDSSKDLKNKIVKIITQTIGLLFILVSIIWIVSKSIKYVLTVFLSIVCTLLISIICYCIFDIKISLNSLAGMPFLISVAAGNAILALNYVLNKREFNYLLGIAGSLIVLIGAPYAITYMSGGQNYIFNNLLLAFTVSLTINIFVVLFFLPATVHKLSLQKKDYYISIKKARCVKSINQYYITYIKVCHKYKKTLVVGLLLLFGLPVFMMPNKVTSNSKWAQRYNLAFGSNTYKIKIRPWIDRTLGGTLRLFLIRHQNPVSYASGITHAELNIVLKMPYGVKLWQTNKLVMDFELLLKKFKEIKQFEIKIPNAQSATITIKFNEAYEKGPFPYVLKNLMEKKAINTGLAEFRIWGIGESFNNEIPDESAVHAIILKGYNYRTTQRLAERVKTLLSENTRVEKISISAEQQLLLEKVNYDYIFNINNPEKLVVQELLPGTISNALNDLSASTKYTGVYVPVNGTYVHVLLSSKTKMVNIWELMNEPINAGNNSFVKLSDFARISKERVGNYIERNDQEYQLIVNYDFAGSAYLNDYVEQRVMKTMKKELPLGYKISSLNEDVLLNSEANFAIIVILSMLIVFVICAIIINNLFKAFVITALLPISFVGIFIAATLFRIPFDEGGCFGFMILIGLSGGYTLTVLFNYGIESILNPIKYKISSYIKAVNMTAISLGLSICCVILGLSSYIIYSDKEYFWYSFSIILIGGLCVATVSIIFLFPVFLVNKPFDRSNG
jgi:multidrug efflux pump subunit AcrB